MLAMPCRSSQTVPKPGYSPIKLICWDPVVPMTFSGIGTVRMSDNSLGLQNTVSVAALSRTSQD